VNLFQLDFFLSGFDLTPTYKNIHNKFSVKYYLNLVLIDEEDRRYFKQTDITLFRKKPGEEVAPQNNMIRLKDEKRKKRKKKKGDDTNKKEDFQKNEETQPSVEKK